jgi:phosphoribosyl-AMP cyclohydrolase
MKVLLPNFWFRGGLVIVIVQDIFTNEILMVAFTNKSGYLETLKTGFAVYFSRSRWKRWKKGEESGNVQIVRQVLINCDGSAIIYKVEQKGEGACHTKAKSCFYRDFLGKQIMSAPKIGWNENLLETEIEIASSLSGKKMSRVVLPNFSKRLGFLDVVVQDFSSNQILMAGLVDRSGYLKTIQTGQSIYCYSPQHELWFKKNLKSHTQFVREILVDCDGDSLVYKVECANRNTCHNESQSSFYRTFADEKILETPLCAENLFKIEVEIVSRLSSKVR